MELEQVVRARGSYDLTPTEPHHQNYGIHCMELQFAVKGDLGAVDCNMNTHGTCRTCSSKATLV